MDNSVPALNFIEKIIEDDLTNGFSSKSLRFRFPPEPNGFLHIGHVKAICLNFNLGLKYNAPVNLRFDDTNPQNEESKYEYAETITSKELKELLYVYASDYFEGREKLTGFLIDNNLAYVDSQSSELIAEQKGTPLSPGSESPFRNQPPAKSRKTFVEMSEGKHPEGSYVLRAKIDMKSPNMLMRDPVIYRVLDKTHHRTSDKWKVYPTYDWTHGESDYIEQISHSLCTLEFKPHRDLYDWFLKTLPINKSIPKQTEFARLNLSYTVTSKRKLKQL